MMHDAVFKKTLITAFIIFMGVTVYNQLTAAQAPQSKEKNNASAVNPAGFSALQCSALQVKLFESGSNGLGKDQRVYKTKFVSEETRYVNWELYLEFKDPRGRVEFDIEAIWSDSDEHEISRQSVTANIQAGWTQSLHSFNCGDNAPGAVWKPGNYTVELKIDNKRIELVAFSIVPAAVNHDAAANSQAVIQKIDGQSAEQKPESFDALLEIADKEFADGNYNSALVHYLEALKMEPDNLVVKVKARDTQLKIKESEKPAKYAKYLEKADGYYDQGDIRYAFIYLIEAYRSYPGGYGEIRARMQALRQKNASILRVTIESMQEDLKTIRREIDAMLAEEPSAPAAAIVKNEEPAAPPAAAAKIEEPAAPVEKFLLGVKAKALKVYQNDKGFWEAEFAHKIILIYIPEGQFTIGSQAGQGKENEYPEHKVYLDGYWLAKTETTFAQYDRFCDESSRKKPGDENWGRGDMPAINVSWTDAVDYCAWLTQKTGLKFRLPSEAEWEKAAHGLYPWGAAKPDSQHANFNKGIGKTAAVGSYPGGEGYYGHFDQAGNVWEWCGDYYDATFYKNSPARNPKGPERGVERVVRGGSYVDGAGAIRSANRDKERPASQLAIIGFRIALDGK